MTSALDDEEVLADAVLEAVEKDADDSNPAGLPAAFVTGLTALRDLGIGFVRRYNRLTINVQAAEVSAPASVHASRQ